MNTYEAIVQHCNKTIVSVIENNGDIVIQFNDNSHIVLENRNCNTCGGYRVEGGGD